MGGSIQSGAPSRLASLEAVRAYGGARLAGTAAQPSAPMPSLGAPRGAVAPMAEVRRVMSKVGLAAQEAFLADDPAALVRFLTMRARETQESANESAAMSNSTASKAELAERKNALDKAAEAQRSASTWGLLGKIAAYIAIAASAIAGVCGAVFTGGTSIAGAVALAFLLAGTVGSLTTMALQDSGAISPSQAKWGAVASAIMMAISACCSFGASLGGAALRIAATAINMVTSSAAAAMQTIEAAGVHIPAELKGVCMGITIAGALTSAGLSLGSLGRAASAAASAAGGALGAGAAAGTQGSDALRAFTRVLGLVTRAVEAGVQVTGGVGSVGQAVETDRAERAHLDGEKHKHASERLQDQLEQLVDALRDIDARYQRANRAMTAAIGAESTARRALVGNLQRG